MMAAHVAVAALDAAGVRLHLAADGTVRLSADAPPPPDVLALARAHRDTRAALLADRERAAATAAPEPTLHQVAPTWDGISMPRPAQTCFCCGSRRYWTEAQRNRGWRCRTCHPPDHLAPEAVTELHT